MPDDSVAESKEAIVPRLSIIIPFSGDVGPLEDTLVSILQNRPRGCEVIVADAEGYSDPYGVGDEVRFIRTQRGLRAMLAAGLAAARADIVHPVQCGVEVEEGWTTGVLRHFDNADVGSVAPVVQLDQSHQVVVGVSYRWGGQRKVVATGVDDRRHRESVIGPSVLAGFYRRSSVEQAGGFEGRVGDSVLDVDLALAMQSLGYRCVVEPASRVHARQDASRPRESAYQLGRQAELLFWRSRSAGLAAASASHALTVGCDFLSELPHPRCLGKLVGRIAAWFEVRGMMRRSRSLAEPGSSSEPITRIFASSPQPGTAHGTDHPVRRRAA